MSIFELESTCRNVSFYSHTIDPKTPGVTGVLNLTNGHTLNSVVPDCLYTLEVDLQNNISLTGQLGTPSPAVVVMTSTNNGVVNFPVEVDTAILKSNIINVSTTEPSSFGQQMVNLMNSSSTARHSIGLNNGENGSNSGGDFSLFSYTDSGLYLSNPLTIKRNDGSMVLESSITSSMVKVVPLAASNDGELLYSYNTPSNVLQFATGLAFIPDPLNPNSGSNYCLFSYDDGGNYMGTPIMVTRSSGDTLFNGNVTVTGKITSSNPTSTPLNVMPLYNNPAQLNLGVADCNKVWTLIASAGQVVNMCDPRDLVTAGNFFRICNFGTSSNAIQVQVLGANFAVIQPSQSMVFFAVMNAQNNGIVAGVYGQA